MVLVTEIEDIVHATTRAPPWCNGQPLHLMFPRSAIAQDLSDKMGKAAGKDNYSCFGAPKIAIFTKEEELGLNAATAFSGSVMLCQLAAQAKRVGLIAQSSIAAIAGFIHDHPRLPLNQKILSGISF